MIRTATAFFALSSVHALASQYPIKERFDCALTPPAYVLEAGVRGASVVWQGLTVVTFPNLGNALATPVSAQRPGVMGQQIINFHRSAGGFKAYGGNESFVFAVNSVLDASGGARSNLFRGSFSADAGVHAYAITCRAFLQ